jgi:predicted metal-dependent peptidase
VEDYSHLNKDLDKAKTSIFMGKHPTFFGSLMCSLNFRWDTSIKTAGTNAIDLVWNPDFFTQLTPKARETVLKHELWHVARLHHIRQGTRDHQNWNIACDYRINNDLHREGCSFQGIENCCLNPSYDDNGIMAEEDIYDLLQKLPPPSPDKGSWQQGDDGDLIPQKDSQANHAATVNAVVRAVQEAKLAGEAGSIPGSVEEILKNFLEPQIPWRTVFMQWFTDLLNEDFTWRRPNRRFSDIYLPSRFLDDGRLEHLAYYLDVSGSISASEILTFNSEVKYIQETLKPERLTLIQFDVRITNVKEFKEEDPFDEIQIVGRGGTSLVPVKAHIEKIKPTAAVIFTDLQVPPMQPLDFDIPVIWVTTSKAATVPFGKLIRLS